MKTNSKSVPANLELWKAIKSLGLPNKSGRYIVGALAENQIVKHDTRSIFKTFKSFYSNLEGNLLQNFQSHQINMQLILSLIIIKKFCYLKISNWTQPLKIVCLSY